MFIIAALITASNVSHSAPLREQQFPLSIDRGPLDSVLKQLSHQTGLHLGTEITVAGSSTSHFGPFVGYVTADEAMRELLGGTDVWYAWRAEDTVRLFLVSSQRTSWSTGVATAKEASDSIKDLSGIHYETGACANLLVGPFSSDEPMTAEAFWVELIKQHCPVIPKRTSDIEPSSVDRQTLAGKTEHSFTVPEMPRLLALRRISEQAGVMLDYLSTDAQEEQTLVGPISGSMSLNEALKRAIRDSVLRIRWGADDAVSVEPAYTVAMYADMTACPCNFGLPEMRPVESRDLTVTDTRLPPIPEYPQAPVTVFDRAFIDAAGASTIPELLNYLAQQSFSRSRAYRSNAGQYFEGRGFGAQYSLVLIDGHRAYGSAGDPMTNAFDLNMIPLAAVERFEVSLDQPSLRYGTDAIGGTVNIVLRQAFQENTATLSWGAANGGAERSFATLLADWQWRDTKMGFVFDRQARDMLLGSKRDRWSNQDFTRYPGGQDYRLPYGVPPTVHSIADADVLPGLNANSAAIAIGRDGLTLRPNQTNRASALSYTAIDPEHERSSLYAFAHTRFGTAEIRFGMLYGQQQASLQLFPESIVNRRWSANHPENPFDVDVNISTLLTGVPTRTQEGESTLQRYTIDAEGDIGDWVYSAFFATHEENARDWLTNLVNPVVLDDSLTTNDPNNALTILSGRPGEGRLPPDFFLPRQINRFGLKAQQFGAELSGILFSSHAVRVETDIGVERRLEAVDFDASVGQLERDLTSTFWRLRIPIVSNSAPSFLSQWELHLGARRDFYNDVRDVTTWQSSLSWQPLTGIKLHAAYTTLFRPPSLYELYLPEISLPYSVLDPRHNEVTALTWVSGGNPLLQPTEGESIDIGLSFRGDRGWKGSLNYWDTRMTDRIYPVQISDLLNASEAVEDRIVRDSTGRLVSLNTTQANFGAMRARGFDVSIGREIRTSHWRLTPKVELTHTMDFRHRDLPGANSPMSDRAGVASLYGTVPSQRVVASVMLEMEGLSGAVFARRHSSYKDYSIVAGAAMTRRIPAQTLLDLKISKALSERLTLSLGANNVLDDQAPFAQVGGWEGFDSSQGDLVGRIAFLDITGAF